MSEAAPDAIPEADAKTAEEPEEVVDAPLTEAEIEELKVQMKRQETQKIGSYWLQELKKHAVRNWNDFYKHNGINFFKDRHYLQNEVPEIVTASRAALAAGAPMPVWMEVGSGVGNALLPLMELLPHLRVQTMDCSRRAVELLKAHPSFDATRCEAHVCDIAKTQFPFAAASADFASLVFVLSALDPADMPFTLAQTVSCLRPGGMLYLRDYAAYDMAMVRFGPGTRIAERFYRRGDGTRAYFFEREELEGMLRTAGFARVETTFVRRTIENRKQELKMRRIWIQVKAFKSEAAEAAANPASGTPTGPAAETAEDAGAAAAAAPETGSVTARAANESAPAPS